MMGWIKFAFLLGLSAVDIKGSCITESWFLPGFGPHSNSSWSPLDCSAKCSSEPDCKYWNWRDQSGCFLKTDKNPNIDRQLTGKFVGGHKDCRPGEVEQANSQDTPHGDSCLSLFWLVPGFAPLKNVSWSATDCSLACSGHETCAYWNWDAESRCWLKTDKNPDPARGFEGPVFVGGPKDCKPLATKGFGFGGFVQGLAQGFLQGVHQGINQGPPRQPPQGQRCAGRNYGGRRCCTPENPCNEGEGDCDGPADGGQHDGHNGCKGSLVCGSNNCKKFGAYYHEKDDCCEKPSLSSSGSGGVQVSFPNNQGSPSGSSNIPSIPPNGQRCSGRNYGARRCCTPQNPCNEGEGDCDGPDDGGQHDGHAGCKGSLVCGSNNCKKFGTYFHEKDDCCEKPSLSPSSSGSGGFQVSFPTNQGSSSSSSSSSSGGFEVSFPNTQGPSSGSSNIPSKPPRGQRCSGRNFGGRGCCSAGTPCNEGEGDCEGDNDCKRGLNCGNNNCKKFGTYYHEKDDCCEKPSSLPLVAESSPEFPQIPHQPPFGQRCSGRNYGERRCCTPENPCDEGEGDCDGPGDGGQHDGHAGCKGSLVCGSNNCKKFGTYFHEKDDCCEKPSSSSSGSFPNRPSSGSSIIPLEPPNGQRCSGRNYGDRRCCSPENPCNEGEGDCDGPGDGGQHDGHAGCKGSLVCGSNNCKKFGAYFHEKDDCCENPSSSSSENTFVQDGWSSWGAWTECNRRCGGGTKSRDRSCSGPSCRHTNQSQQRPCNTHQCFDFGNTLK